ncbi:MAG TPA: hypothetical protein VM145_08030 [Sphingomicrobium sp.]|nr:hypothetical protein [Sphingomicrobium sp.]
MIEKMRGRVEQCRRLAKFINDPRTNEALLKMAEEGEADIRRLEAEEASPGQPGQDS